MSCTNNTELKKIVDSTFSNYYYMLSTHRTWDYIEMVKQELLTELNEYINETKLKEFK